MCTVNTDVLRNKKQIIIQNIIPFNRILNFQKPL